MLRFASCTKLAQACYLSCSRSIVPATLPAACAVQAAPRLQLARAPVRRLLISGGACRVRREEERIQQELLEREEEEARKLLADIQKKGGSRALKLKEGEKLDKRAVQARVPLQQA